jgi:hypothetical protein
LGDDGDLVAGGLLAEGFGPEAVAVAVVGVTNKADVAGQSRFFFDGVEVRTEFVVDGDTEFAVFELGSEAEGEALFDGAREVNRLDLVAVTLLGFFGGLDTVTRRPAFNNSS